MSSSRFSLGKMLKKWFSSEKQFEKQQILRKRTRLSIEVMEDRVTPTVAPTVNLPANPIRVDLSAYTISGMLAAPSAGNTTAYAYRDVNNNSTIDIGTDLQLASVLIDTVGVSAYSLAPNLLQGQQNYFLVAADDGSGLSSAVVVPTITEDSTAPTLVSIVKADSDPTNATVVNFTVTFSENVSGVDATDFALSTTGAFGTSPTIVTVSGSGSVRTVAVNTGTGSGTIQLNLVDDDTIQDVLDAGTPHPLGGTGTGAVTNGPAYTIDKTAPVGYTIAADDALINASEAPTTSFTFTAAEVGATYSYSVSSTGGGTPVTGSGAITTANQPITGINVSTLPDGTLTYSVTLTDPAGNSGSAATATAVLDATAPAGYTIAANSPYVNASQTTNAGFTFAAAEVGATYSYSVSSTGGGTPVTGSGAITTANQPITGINVSTLPDGTLTYSVTLTDPAGNSGSAATATAVLDATAPAGYTIAANSPYVNASQTTNAGFTFAAAEVGATYSYSVSSSGGGTPVTGSGAITAANQQITGIDVSGLSDGTLTYSVTLTDPAGNTGSATTATAVLDIVAPVGYTIAADDALINASEASTTSFTFTAAEVGATYSYSVSSTGGGTPVTGSGA
ncbi:MAG: hypothetical protein K2X38_17805, partial [Gemmataceae bacterium]|nr:hypothetical protein [Gemmataceae bacterium]